LYYEVNTHPLRHSLNHLLVLSKNYEYRYDWAMTILSLFIVGVFAAQPLLSPLQDDVLSHAPTPAPAILGVTTGLMSPIQDGVLLPATSSLEGSGLTITPPLVASPTAVVTLGPALPSSVSTASQTGLPIGVSTSGTQQTTSPTNTPIPKPAPHRSKQSAYTIAFLGDSMIDTLGPDLPNIQDLLHTYYPATKFTLQNYGVGATNIDYGITRLTNDYDYLGVHKSAILAQNPDIVVVESFAYNPYSYDVGALDQHWLALAKIVDTVRARTPKAQIVIAATISPNNLVFGDGAPGISMDPTGKREKVATIQKYLDSTIAFAKSQNLPLADVYHPSLDSTGNGKVEYINPGDHIHYSDEGRALFARIFTDTVINSKLIE
jgi:hypothetical protein